MHGLQAYLAPVYNQVPTTSTRSNTLSSLYTVQYLVPGCEGGVWNELRGGNLTNNSIIFPFKIFPFVSDIC